MRTEYAVINPANGAYVRVGSLEEVSQKVAEFALDFYKTHTHNAFCTTVTVGDDGSEVWGNAADAQPVNMEELAASTQAMIAVAVSQQ